MSKFGLLDPGTCLPVLEAICHVYEINEALEFGAGIWSTFCLTRNCKSVTSVENVESWANKVYEEYGHRKNLTVVKWSQDMETYLDSINDNFDLIFIDGENRVNCLNKSFNRSPIIICHDTHQPILNWHLVNVPSSYKQLTYTGCDPYLTTIFYDINLNVKDIMFNKDNFSHKGTFIDTDFWSDIDIVNYYKKINV